MKTLNAAPDLLDQMAVHAATDITGFGLAGHAMQMAQASDVAMLIDTAALPVLPGALHCLAGILNRAHHSNAAYTAELVSYEGVSTPRRWLTVDPQTSGGLLLALPEAAAPAALARLRERGFPWRSASAASSRRARRGRRGSSSRPEAARSSGKANSP